MKIRIGFVSNSSSSSFVIATNLTLEETLDKLLNFNSKHNFILFLENDLKSFFLEKSKKVSKDEYKKHDFSKKDYSKYKNLYIGFASSEVVDPVEYLVCNYLEMLEENDEYFFEKHLGH